MSNSNFQSKLTVETSVSGGFVCATKNNEKDPMIPIIREDTTHTQTSGDVLGPNYHLERPQASILEMANLIVQFGRHERISIMKLIRQAQVWLTGVEYDLRLQGQVGMTWEEMKLVLKRKYLPQQYQYDLFDDLTSLSSTTLIKHKAGTKNKVADMYSRVHHLILTSTAVQVLGFDSLKQDYSTYKDFKVIYEDLVAGQQTDYAEFSLYDGYHFKGT
ncbi:hypothetical protein ACH5RR_015380 [Cinchona calisaya]|uniref:Uncharacterized protein n=1 Tax=Cinchona calisaya TaxID=153742 RepID=A0ABD2ZT07_9GENT